MSMLSRKLVAPSTLAMRKRSFSIKWPGPFPSKKVSRLIPFILLVKGLTAASIAYGEGSNEMGSAQILRAATILYVDVLDKDVETISWIGTGAVRILAPNGSEIGVFGSPSTVALSSYTNGKYRLELSDNQADWDISVLKNTEPQTGRLWSLNWLLDAGPNTEVTNTSYYALVDGGADSIDSVVELKFEGLAGLVYAVAANETGIDGNTTNSTFRAGNTFTPTIPLYLNPPAISSYDVVDPLITNFAVIKSSAGDYEFSFATNARGVCHLIIDAEGDGTFSLVAGGDIVISGSCTPGVNTFSWDGTDNYGFPVPEGTYEIVARVHVGEIHQIADDIETISPGLSFFSVQRDGSGSPLALHWNDTRLTNPTEMIGDGVNSHAWGDSILSSGGDDAFINTFSWIADDQSGALELTVVPAGPGPTEDPDIVVIPMSISFGDVFVGNIDSSGLSIGNEGAADLAIGTIGGSNGLTTPFLFGIDNCSNESIAPGSSCTVEVIFQPITIGEFNDSFNIPSNDPDTPNVTVALSGHGIQPLLGVNITGPGMVTSNPPGIDCPDTCEANFQFPDSVDLLPTPDLSWTVGTWIWSGACTGDGGCSVLMDQDQVVDVTFRCELITIPVTSLPITSPVPTWECANLEAVDGFSVGEGGVVSFEATESIRLGSGFRVGNGGVFKATVSS